MIAAVALAATVFQSVAWSSFASGVVLSSPCRAGDNLATTWRLPGDAQDKPFTETLPESAVKFEMVPVPGGTVVIGDETVTVKPFYMATTETPWEVFDQFLLSGEPSRPYDQTEFAPDAIARPSRSYILPDKGWGHQGYPVINVSSTSVMMFCRWLSSVTDKKYRVPTEAEWDLACRAGEASEESAWHKDNSDEVTHPVGKKTPNMFGLFDMFGNVGEWATDLAGKPVLCGGIFTDSLADMSPSLRRYWSKEWQAHDPQLPKSRWWLSNGHFVGFRLVCEPEAVFLGNSQRQGADGT